MSHEPTKQNKNTKNNREKNRKKNYKVNAEKQQTTHDCGSNAILMGNHFIATCVHGLTGELLSMFMCCIFSLPGQKINLSPARLIGPLSSQRRKMVFCHAHTIYLTTQILHDSSSNMGTARDTAEKTGRIFQA